MRIVVVMQKGEPDHVTLKVLSTSSLPFPFKHSENCSAIATYFWHLHKQKTFLQLKSSDLLDDKFLCIEKYLQEECKLDGFY